LERDYRPVLLEYREGVLMYPYPPSEKIRVDMALAIEQLSQRGLSEVRRDVALRAVEGIMASNEAPAAMLDLVVLAALLIRDDDQNFHLMLKAFCLDGDHLCTPETDHTKESEE
jgi:hypothetical protein